MNPKSAINQQLNAVLRVSYIAIALSFAPVAHALDNRDSREKMILSNQLWFEVLNETQKHDTAFKNGFSNSNKPTGTNPRILAQQKNSSERAGLRSKSDVVREVKRKYDAEVLKISLNSSGSLYRVRILMPNGRIRDVSVSARR